MGPVLEGLIKLQSVENRLRAARAKLNRCRRSVIIQENQVRSLQNALEAKTEEIQLTKVQSDRLELELKSRDESIAKLRASLNAAKTNKEYAAVLTQLNTTKADNAKIENQALEVERSFDAGPLIGGKREKSDRFVAIQRKSALLECERSAAPVRIPRGRDGLDTLAFRQGESEPVQDVARIA